MKRNRKLFLAGFDEKSPLVLHCVSRVVDRQFLFGEEEREKLVELMRTYEKFCGVQILSYCMMSNHIHLLVKVPPRSEIKEMSDKEFLERLGALYSKQHVKEVRARMGKCRKNKAPKALRELKEKYTYRMGNISEFMKTLKQCFTRWYNKKHGRCGTLWEERYHCQAVEEGATARLTAAYIDLNPLRAGMVKDPKDYRWSSYGEAVAGGKVAQAGYETLYERRPESSSSKKKDRLLSGILAEYRILLSEEGEEDQLDSPIAQGEKRSQRIKHRRGFSAKEVEEILQKKGKLSRGQMLRCRVRYFTDSVVMGSQSFVQKFQDTLQEKLGVERKTKASRIPRVQSKELYSYRHLQKEAMTASSIP